MADTIAKGTNLQFKNGLQSALDTIRSNKTATEGTFYLTSDTHRLYVGRITDKNQTATACDAVPVNQGVTFVNSVSGLPGATTAEQKRQLAGQFYYVGDSNILCVFSGAPDNKGGYNGGWVQINPNTDTKVTNIANSVATENNVSTVTTTLSSKDSTNPQGATDKISDSFKVKGAGGVTVSSTDKEITLTGEQYEIKTTAADNKATIKLESTSGNDDSSITIAPVPGGHVKVTGSGSEITLNSDISQLRSVTGASAEQGFSITVIDEIVAANAPKGSQPTINQTKQGTIDPIIAVGADPSLANNQVHFENGVATLNVYTKDEINTKFKAFNAMEFKGVTDSLPTGNPSAGDTYKASTVFNFTNPKDKKVIRVNKGDLLIATGTENNDGVIASNVDWQVVPSGDDTVFQYIAQKIEHGVSLKNKADANDIIFNYALTANSANATTGGNPIQLTDTTTGSTDGGVQNVVVNVAHGKYATPVAQPETDIIHSSDPKATTIEINTVTEVVSDDYGHVTGFKTVKHKIAESTVSKVNINATSDTNKTTATVTNTVTTRRGSDGVTFDQSDKFQVKSSTLQVSATARTASAATAISVDMVWGTF